jgi:ABC-type dipeptide/oligopeptide/nickel transport system permease subunit
VSIISRGIVHGAKPKDPVTRKEPEAFSFAPGFAIMLVVFAFNMVGDGLRDALDPRLRGLL